MHVALQYLLDDSRLLNAIITTHLPAFLQRQRWYTSKDKTIRSIELTGLPSANEDHGLWLANLKFSDNSNELRVLAVAEVDRAFAPDDLRVVCKTKKGVLIDALGEEGFRESMYDLMANEAMIVAQTGRIVGQAGSVCRNQSDGSNSHIPAQNSSNSVVVYPPDGFFKLFRKTEAGLHPDAELIAYLSEACGFENVPAFGGAIRFEPANGGDPITLGLMLGKIDHQGEAWETFLHDVAGYAKRYRDSPGIQEVGFSGHLSKRLVPDLIPSEIRLAMGEETIARLLKLGQRTAQMHSFFGEANDPGLVPEALTRADWASAKTGLMDRLRNESAFAKPDVAEAQHAIAGWLESISFPEVYGGKIRVHGDYHLGQVLITPNDVVIIDFEGEPLYTLAYRRQRHPAYKDVAGMVRSLHYAPYAYALQEVDGAEWAMAAAKMWYRVASRLFLTAYHDEVGESSFLPNGAPERKEMLAFYLADKAMYELAYERSSRPDWIMIPQTGILGVAEMLALD
ncbi:MAG: hypothetical protein AB8F78_14870 [Saprospiraceae bacterium]